ncbi:MAG: hypothetical protein RMI49_04205 [Candidatus Caldarchaeum sp.]|nr:hypothetical protein [Candidatus Caldarchaeum sp.]
MIPKSAIIPPPNGMTSLLFLTLTLCVIVLYIMLIVFGSKKIHVPVITHASHHAFGERPLERLNPPRQTTQTQRKTYQPEKSSQQQPDDYSKRLEKLDQILNQLEAQIKNRPETSPTQTIEELITDNSEPSPELSEILRIAKSLKEEINGIMTARKSSR